MSGGPGRPLLPAVDRAAFAVALASRLRARGVRVGHTPVQDFVRALDRTPPASRTALYWTARICLIRDHDGLAEFDAVFEAVFGDALLAADPHARRNPLGNSAGEDDEYTSVDGAPRQEQDGGGLPWVTLPPAVAGADDSDDNLLTVPERLPSELDGLMDTPFGQLSPQEMALLGRRLETALRDWPTRRSRRFAPRPGGARIAVRATMARSRRTGWEPVRLVRAGQVARPRRVVMLCDVSQSMQPQAVAYLHLMRALALTADAEVFAFATSLTRLTTVLTHRSADVAVAEASERVVDRFGGTRIATSLQTLLTSHHGSVLRGAVVIIGSDGWDGDPPEQLTAAMTRLRRRAHRVIWLNPRASAPGFVPSTSTMAAALPHCDALLPAHTFASLLRLTTEVVRCARHGAAHRRSPAVSSTASRGRPAGTARL
ncbi:VWA domain-containing protein [Streptomyces sp. ACA25]|uniref:vWA domain-containing protein n=1 Tax=Streptomyces sp. ACA25 TaxID=3022596 RepID=UPI002306EA66|nr:VWA domain-containing protein [Streptomyces sp. ACA25]MDB1086435.1 VWA domain-containing protein [Streptomyces sp. ACA25]